ncbi:T-complex protein 1 subunit gamma [Trichoplax sp. H2]|nr:T-complex protein 1 subunit gamma [Trichoplax sp. H2]|eukprot:RDD43552.1 T-complex protein 1 subunit gamma [Trichoplax sp. H2]
MSVAMIRTASQICNSLEDILAKTYGPVGMDVLIDVMSTNVVATNHGSTIINSLQISHPVGQLITNSVKKFYDKTGDGSTSFVLIMASMMRQILRHAESEDTNNKWRSDHKETIIKLSRAFRKVNIDLDQYFTPILHKMATCLTDFNKNSVIVSLNGIITTAMNGKFGSLAVEKLTKITVELILRHACNLSTCEALNKTINKLVDEFYLIVTEIPQIPLSESCILNGILLRYNSKGVNDKLIAALSNQKYPSLIRKFTFKLDQSIRQGEHTSLSFSRSSQVDGAVEYQQSRIRRFLSKLQDENVKLIISTESVTDVAVYLCNRAGIIILANVAEEEANRIGYYCNLGIIYEVDMEETLISKFTGITSCQFITKSTQRYIQFIPQLAESNRMYHLLLCGLAKELCHQYRAAIHNSLKCVLMWLDPPYCLRTYQPCTVPGGGATEFALARALKVLPSNDSYDPVYRSACQILSESLLAIPRTLYNNSTNSTAGGFIRILKEIDSESSALGSRNWKGINPYTGHLVSSHNVIEPMYIRYYSVRQCLQVITQILKIDKVISAIGCGNRRNKADEQDN